MNRRHKTFYRSAAAGLVLLLLAAFVAAAAGPYELAWQRVTAGGESSGAGYVLIAAAGQAEAGSAAGSGYALTGGVWSGADAPPPLPHRTFLPVTAKYK